MKTKVKALDIQKMSEASVIHHGYEKILEKDPKAQAVLKAYNLAKECIERIQEMTQSIEHLVEGGRESFLEYEIVDTSVKKKAGKTPGDKQVFVIKNPHSGEVIEVRKVGGKYVVPEAVITWIKTYGETVVRDWIEIVVENEKGA